MNFLVYSIVFPPLGAFVYASILKGRYSDQVCLYTVSFSAFLSIFLVYNVVSAHLVQEIVFFNWFSIGSMKIDWGFYVCPLSATMSSVVTFISSMVILYSIEYMKEDPNKSTYMSFLALFVFFMLVLVNSNNLVMTFFGWEGIGLASYLLINFWRTNVQSNKSALKSMIMNRIGDFGLLIAIFAIYDLFRTLDFAALVPMIGLYKHETLFIFGYEIKYYNIIAVGLCVGMAGKSAQLFLHTWLPDAMQAPSPVSALLHAATLVTAGVFLLVRFSFLLELCPSVLKGIVILGASTAFFGSTVALVQNDIKRIIAYSTCSQLGYMIAACGLSAYDVAMFHLVNHAFFKALLFLSAGAVIHAVSGEQDIRRMGGLLPSLPFVYSCFAVGSLSLAGLPFLSGFYSKDLIIEISYSTYSSVGWYAFVLLVVSALFTSVYSFKMLYLVFLNRTNLYKPHVGSIHEPGIPMSLPLLILAIPSVLSGAFFKEQFVGLGSNYWHGSIFVSDISSRIDAEFITSAAKLAPTVGFVLGIFFVPVYLYTRTNFGWMPKFLSDVYMFLNKRWLFDAVYNRIALAAVFSIAHSVGSKSLDKGLLSSYWSEIVINKFGSRIRTVQTGYLYHYLSMTIIGLVGLLLFLSPTFLPILVYKAGFIALLSLYIAR